MRHLLLGLIEFREHNLPLYAERFRELSAGQEPGRAQPARLDGAR